MAIVYSSRWRSLLCGPVAARSTVAAFSSALSSSRTAIIVQNAVRHSSSSVNATGSNSQQDTKVLRADFSSIGFVGLGNMGLPTARNLMAAGFSLKVFDVNESAVRDIVTSGATKMSSPKELATQSTLVFSMLPSLEHVKDVYLGQDGILQNLPNPETFVVEASTIGPLGSKEVAAEARRLGHRMIDAPVSGGVTAATAGTLTFMVGSTEREFQAIVGFLRKIGRTVFHCGGESMGQATKVCNNLILACCMMGVSEGYRLAEHLGLDPQLFNEIVNSSSGRCWVSELYNPVPHVMPNVPASRAYKGGFSVKLIAKDLQLSMDAAEAVHTTLPVTKEVSRMYSDLEKNGFADMDFSCVYLHNK